MNRAGWTRALAAGVLWAVAYNGLWGAAWFLFMRREWLAAMAAIHQPLPWTSELLVVWAALTLPLGAAIMLYAARRPPGSSRPRAAVIAGVALWVQLTLGMAGWAAMKSLPIHLLAVDSIVNLITIAAASFTAARLLRQ